MSQQQTTGVPTTQQQPTTGANNTSNNTSNNTPTTPLDNTVISSREHTRFKNMIYLSVIDLVDGLKSLRNKGEYEFVAADSSFILRFLRNNDNVLIVHNKNKYGPMKYSDLLSAVLSGIGKFIDSKHN